MAEKIANWNARHYVEGLRAFKGNNTFGRNVSETCYVVYSYGTHFPMYAWVSGKGWYRNSDKYSVTTSKHQSQLRPNVPSFIRVNTETLKAIIANNS